MKVKYAVCVVFFSLLLGTAITLNAGLGSSVWDALVEGNKRFVQDKSMHRSYSETREKLTKGQKPPVTIVTCSDSRVSPERVFDQGLGDVFVIRTAGNVLDPVDLGSIEYGVEHLHCPLLIIMGHESCGAVTATVDAVESGAHIEGNIAAIVDAITPAVENTPRNGMSKKAYVEECVASNVSNVIKNLLERSEITAHLVSSGKLQIVGAKYMLSTGEVKIIKNAQQTLSMLNHGSSGSH